MCFERHRFRCLAVLLFLLALAPLQAFAQTSLPRAGEYQAYLVTYAPGDAYWERFGHNAIWLQEAETGLNHSFNFGFFDFEQDNFLLRFVQGRMLYFSAAMPVEQEMDFYRGQNRAIRVQKLELDAEQFARLRDHLLEQVKRENRDYLYDYYLDNCSTRLRDALDLALDGALSEQFKAQPALQSFRDHTRRSTFENFWYYLGLELALGAPVDADRSRWDEMFLPVMLADNLGEVSVLDPQGLRHVVGEDQQMFASQAKLPPAQPPETWPRYLTLSVGIILLAWLAARLAPIVLVEAFMQAWMLIAGTLGALMVLIWLATDHAAANPNANLFLLNPLMVLALVPALRRPVAVIVAMGLLCALVVLFLPSWQYTRDVAAMLVPLNLATCWRLWFCPAPSSGRGAAPA